MAREPEGRSRSSRIRPWALALAIVLALPAGARADRLGGDHPFDLTADSVEYERGRDLYLARGNVRISQPERTLTADWVSFSNVTGRGLATGNVVVTEGADTLYADVLVFEVDALRGVVLDGRLDARESEFLMSGKEIRKTGENTYEFEEGTFTTCRCPDDGTEPWQIQAERADLEVGGYGTARNTTFEVLGVPVIWLPWMVYPLKTERQTGLLFPEFGNTSRLGTTFGLPFFWAARPNVNVTVTPRYLTERGFMPRLESEYLIGEKSGGAFLGSALRDRDHESDDPDYPFRENRWGVEWNHLQYLPGDFRFVGDARLFSDNQYAFDFNDFSAYQADRFVESRGFVDRRFGAAARNGGFAAVWFADDHQNPENEDRDRFSLQRLPQVAASFGARPLPLLPRGLRGSLDVDFTNFQARDRVTDVYPDGVATSVDGLFQDNGVDSIPNALERASSGAFSFGANDDFGEGNGRFDEGEPLIDRGPRLHVNPRLSHPVRLFDLIEVYPEVGWLGTGYYTREKDSDLRSLVTGLLEMRMRMRRSIPLPFGLGEAIHLMEPQLAWTGITSQSQRRNPLLVPATAFPQDRLRQLDLFNLTRDTADRIDSANAVSLALGNRFYAAAKDGGPPVLLGDVTLSAQWDFSSKELRDFFLDGRLYRGRNFVTRFNVGYDLDETRVEEALLRSVWSSGTGHDLGLEYRYRRNVPPFFEEFLTADDRFEDARRDFDRVSQLGFRARAALTKNWAVTYNGRYSFKDSLSLTNRAGIEYISRCRCWAVRLEVEDERARGIDVALRYTLIGLGQDAVRPFDGRPSLF